MSQSVLELAKDLTLALIETGNVSSDDMQNTIQKTYATLSALKAQEEMETTTAVPASEATPVDWRKSITKHAVTCLECGQSFRQLSVRHLREHGLDAHSYRAKYGIPRTQPLAAKTTTARRREVAQETRPWEKAPRFMQAHEHDGSVSPEPEAEALPDEPEAPRAAAPAPPKRQRQTAPKKKATRKKQADG